PGEVALDPEVWAAAVAAATRDRAEAEAAREGQAVALRVRVARAVAAQAVALPVVAGWAAGVRWASAISVVRLAAGSTGWWSPSETPRATSACPWPCGGRKCRRRPRRG